MAHAENTTFDLTSILSEGSGNPRMESPSLVVSFGTFGWGDFPLAGGSQQEVQAASDDESPSIVKITNASQVTSEVAISPSPALSFDSFSWDHFPPITMTTFGSENGNQGKAEVKASEETFADYGLGAVTAF